MSVDDSPRGGNAPDKKEYCRRLAGLALKAAITAVLKVLFEKLWQ
ncbi:hypothetical protein [Streptomyces spiralis]